MCSLSHLFIYFGECGVHMYVGALSSACICRDQKLSQSFSIASAPSFIFKIYFILYLCVCMHIFVQVPMDARRVHWNIWTRSCRWLWATQSGDWEPNSYSLEDQQTFLTLSHLLIHVEWALSPIIQLLVTTLVALGIEMSSHCSLLCGS